MQFSSYTERTGGLNIDVKTYRGNSSKPINILCYDALSEVKFLAENQSQNCLIIDNFREAKFSKL